MRVAIVQHDIVWGQPAENLQRLSLMIDGQQGTDLYVLSETFTTGFLPEETKCQDSDEGLEWLQRQARTKDAAFAASVATTDADGQLRNRLYFVRPDGTFDCYDKRHLFGYAGETDAYVAGQERVIVEWRGMRFLLQVCYDLRFPVWSRNRKDYDAAIYVANWPSSRINVWQTLLKARALENQCFVILCAKIIIHVQTNKKIAKKLYSNLKFTKHNGDYYYVCCSFISKRKYSNYCISLLSYSFLLSELSTYYRCGRPVH